VVPEANIQNCLAKCNSIPFDAGYAPWFTSGWTVDTLLFIGCDVKRFRSAAGQRLFTMTYKFLFRPTGWQKLLRSKIGDSLLQELQFQLVSQDKTANYRTGNFIYDRANFDTLFQVP
jgi:hypothetical protein